MLEHVMLLDTHIAALLLEIAIEINTLPLIVGLFHQCIVLKAIEHLY